MGVLQGDLVMGCTNHRRDVGRRNTPPGCGYILCLVWHYVSCLSGGVSVPINSVVFFKSNYLASKGKLILCP